MVNKKKSDWNVIYANKLEFSSFTQRLLGFNIAFFRWVGKACPIFIKLPVGLFDEVFNQIITKRCLSIQKM